MTACLLHSVHMAVHHAFRAVQTHVRLLPGGFKCVSDTPICGIQFCKLAWRLVQGNAALTPKDATSLWSV